MVHSGATVWDSETVTEAAGLSLQFGLEFRLVLKNVQQVPTKKQQQRSDI